MHPSPLSEFHKYGIEWSPDLITWYLDDKPVRMLDAEINMDYLVHQCFLNLVFGVWKMMTRAQLLGRRSSLVFRRTIHYAH